MTLLQLLIFVILHGGTIQESYAPHYSPNLMARVAARRDMQPQACMISSAEYKIGTWLWIYGKRTDTLLYCQVVDVSHPRDVKRHLRTRRLVELSWEVTHALCGTVRGSSAECSVLVITLEEK